MSKLTVSMQNSMQNSLQNSRHASQVEMESSNAKVDLNVGGMVFRVLRRHFDNFPTTKLSKLMACQCLEDILEHCDGFTAGDVPEYFFDRNWSTFNSVLDYYRLKSLHLPTNVCPMVFQRDLVYWEIDELDMDTCCSLKYYPDIDTCNKEFLVDEMVEQMALDRMKYEDFGSGCISKCRRVLWNITEYPDSSRLAEVYGIISFGAALIWTITFILQTFPNFQEGTEESKGVNPHIILALEIMDESAIAFFTVEFLVRFICAPRKWVFLKNPLNLVDMIAIMPYYLYLVEWKMEDMHLIGKAGKQVRLIRILRIIRVFKLFRHFVGLQSLLYTLRQAYKELLPLLLMMAVIVLTFASLIYYSERGAEDESQRWTFLDSFWWGIMTLTTVGFAHKSPQTFMGKIVGGMCALVGVFVLTLPIPIVVNSFATYYKNRMWRTEVAQRKAEKLGTKPVRMGVFPTLSYKQTKV